MAIPRLEERKVYDQLSSPTFVRAQATPEDFGAGLGSALGAVGQDITNIAIHEKQKADAFAAAELDAAFSREATKVLYDSKEGFLTKQGGDALDVEPVLERLRKLREDIGAKARNDEQASAFTQRTNDRIETLTRQAETHSAQQRQVYYANTLDGQIDEALEFASVVYTDAKEVQKVFDKVLPLALVQLADNEDLPPEQIAKRVRKLQADIFASAMKGYVARDRGIAGLKFLNENRAKLGARADDFEKVLKPIADKEVGLVTGENFFNASFDDTGMPSTTAALAALREQSGDLKLNVDQFRVAQEQIMDLDAKWRRGYKEDTTVIFGEAHKVWTAAGYNLSAVPEHLKQELLGRIDLDTGVTEWSKLEAMNREWHDAARRSAGKPFDLEQEKAWSRALDTMVPGWTDGKKLEDFLSNGMATSLGPDHWEDFTRKFQADRNRPSAEDGSTATIMEALDARLRQTFGVDRGLGEQWSGVSAEKINARNWAVAQMMRLVSTHHDEARKGEAGKFDPTWYLEPLDKLVENAKDMAKTKQMPATPGFNRPRPSRAAVPSMPVLVPGNQAAYDALPVGTQYKVEGDPAVYTKKARPTVRADGTKVE